MSATRSSSRCAHQDTWWEHLRRGLPVVLGVAALTLVLHHTGWTSGFETAALDSVLLAGGSLEPKNVVVVAITDEDYSAPDLFDETSPLEPRVVHALIDAIALGGASAIGVDLDTSARRFRAFTPSPHWPPVVWACSADPARGRPEFEVGSVLGGQTLIPPPVRGIALLPASFDSVLREYQRWFRTTPHGELQAAFPRALADLVRPSSADGERGAEHLILNALTGPTSFPRISARDVLAASTAEGWKKDGPLEGKVVVLGGSYRAGRDRHRTPAGERDGVELMAQAVELELQGAGIRQVGHGWMFFVEVLSGMCLTLLGHWFSPRKALLLSLGALPLLGVLSSLAVFASLALWASFALPLVGVVLHQTYDRLQESRAKIRELERKLDAADPTASTSGPADPSGEVAGPLPAAAED